MRMLLVGLLLIISSACVAQVRPLTPEELAPITSSIIVFNDEVTSESIDTLLDDLRMLDMLLPKAEVITIELTSPGGSVFAGFDFIHEVLRIQATGRKINGVVNKVCASMCFAMLQTLDKRLSYQYGLIMQHKSSGIFGTNIVTRTLDKQLEEMEAKRIGLPLAIWEHITAANVWLTPKQALEWNVIDAIVLKK